MGNYDSILHKRRPVDTKHVSMSLHNRAAQFAPFDALTGFGGRIHEASRIVGQRIELTDEVRSVINDRLCQIERHIKENPMVTVTYFVPDCTKYGGSYETITAPAEKILPYDERLILSEDVSIAFDDILKLDGPLFSV